MTTWTEKYKPASFAEIKGQEEAISKIKSFMKKFHSKNTPERKKAVIIYGPSGTGKTILAHAMAKETNSEIFELNASDLRNKFRLKETLKPAIEQRSLIKKRKTILIDEADGMSGADKGGIQELVDLIDDTTYPIIITVNDVWSQKLSPLRKICEMIELKELDYKIIKDILIQILRKEEKFIDNDTLTNISIKAKGDLRAAINDLETISKIKDPSKILFDQRNKEISIFEALKKIFKLKPTQDTLKILDSVDMPIDDIILWIEKNIPAEYHGKELVRAYELLSKTDVFKGRIYKQQYWRFLLYESILLSYGMASAKKENKMGFTSYKKPTRILKIWMNNQKTAKKRTIAEKYARKTHISTKKAMTEFPIIKQIIISNPEISKELRLDEDEMVYLKQ